MLFKRRPLSDVERAIGYRFRDPELLERALTHRSFANEQGIEEHYERLEFLGDAVLGLAAAEWLYERYPDDAEGRLASQKSRLVSEKSLAGWARRIRLGEHLRLGIGEERSGGRGKRSLLADALEAVLGAAFLDGGLQAARGIAVSMLDEIDAGEDEVRDPKTRLQEWAQANGLDLPVYRQRRTHGPDHDKTFVVECLLGEAGREVGEGRTKKAAEQRAARAVLEALGIAG